MSWHRLPSHGLAGAVLIIVLFGIVPFYITLKNPGNVLLASTWLVWAAIVLVAAGTWIGFVRLVSRFAGPRPAGVVDALSCGLLAAVTINHIVMFDLTSQVQLDGAEHGIAVTSSASAMSMMVFAAFGVLAAILALKGQKSRVLIPISCALATISSLIPQTIFLRHSPLRPADIIADDFFALSWTRNIIHLLPDSMQSDAVEAVLARDAKLSTQLAGFQLFVNHAGTHPFTAPALPTMFTGEAPDLSSGYALNRIAEDLRQHSVTTKLAGEGVRVHYVGLDQRFCGGGTVSCVVANFGQLEAPAVARGANQEIWNLAVHLELSLLRATPAAASGWVYKDSSWLLSTAIRDVIGFSATPDPLIVDWLTRLRVDDDPRPRYHFYHYIGTHRPFRWNGECSRLPIAIVSREAQLEQTRCVLHNLGRLADRLRVLGVFDQTTIVVASDHGTGVPDPVLGAIDGGQGVDAPLVAISRATLLLKGPGARGPLRFSANPTALSDIPRLLLALQRNGEWRPPAAPRVRRFNRIDSARFHRDGDSQIPVDVFRLPERLTQAEAWDLEAMHRAALAPPALSDFSAEDISHFLIGTMSGGAALREGGGAWMARRLDALIAQAAGSNALRVGIRATAPSAKLTLSLNGRPLLLAEPISVLDPNQWLVERTICLAPGTTIEGNNRVTLAMEASPSSLVSDIRFLKAPECELMPQALRNFDAVRLQLVLKGAVANPPILDGSGNWIGRRASLKLGVHTAPRGPALRIVARGKDTDGAAQLHVKLNGTPLAHPITFRPPAADHWWAETNICLEQPIPPGHNVELEFVSDAGEDDDDPTVLLRDAEIADDPSCRDLPSALREFEAEEVRVGVTGLTEPARMIGPTGIWLGTNATLRLGNSGPFGKGKPAFMLSARGRAADGHANLLVSVGSGAERQVSLRPETPEHWWASSIVCLDPAETSSPRIEVTLRSADDQDASGHSLLVLDAQLGLSTSCQ